MENEAVLKNEGVVKEEAQEESAAMENKDTLDLNKEETENKDAESKENAAKTEETAEYDTFTVELSGITREWAITDEFDFEGKHYLICAEVVGDEISDAGLYLFEGKNEGEELEVKNLDTEEEYNRVAEAYCKFSEEKIEE